MENKGKFSKKEELKYLKVNFRKKMLLKMLLKKLQNK